jgi:hypothetical protein
VRAPTPSVSGDVTLVQYVDKTSTFWTKPPVQRRVTHEEYSSSAGGRNDGAGQQHRKTTEVSSMAKAPTAVAESTPVLSHWIDGHSIEVPAEATAPVFDPSTGAIIARVPRGGAADVRFHQNGTVFFTRVAAGSFT